MIRAILFDFNGVLLDDEAVHFELFRRVLGEEGVELDEGEYYRDYVGFDDEAGFRHALEGRPFRAGEADSRVVELCARKAAYYREVMAERGYPFFDGAQRLVGEASGRGLVLGIVSGALLSEIEAALAAAGLTRLFKTIVAAEHVTRSKPHPEGYRRGLAELNERAPQIEPPLRPENVLAIEDTPAGLEAARAAGLRTLAVAHTYSAERLQGLAHHVVPDIAGLSIAGLDNAFEKASAAG